MTGQSPAIDRDCMRLGAGRGAIAAPGATERRHG